MKRYTKPELELMLIKAEDIIQTSGLIENVGGEETKAINEVASSVKDAAGNDVTSLNMSVFD